MRAKSSWRCALTPTLHLGVFLAAGISSPACMAMEPQESATIQKMIVAHERFLVRADLEKGDVCGAAAKLNTFRDGLYDPADRPLIDATLHGFETTSADTVMACASDYAAVQKLLPDQP